MAGSLQRPSFKIIPASKHKSVLKLQKQSLLCTKEGEDNCGGSSSNNCKQNQQLQQLKYCQSLHLDKLLILLPSSLPFICNDSCWKAACGKRKSCSKNLTAAAAAMKYVQHRQHQLQQKPQKKQQSHRQQKLQILNKSFKSSKFRKNLLNCKKLQQQQLRGLQSFRKNQFQLKTF